MIIELKTIPEEGKHLSGDITEDIFELKPTDGKPAAPTHYELDVSIVSDSILVQGELSATFELECVRCLEPFQQTIHREDFAHSEPIEGRSSIDLTDPIREDILLLLPIHPHCEVGTQRECPAANRFEPSTDQVEEAGNPGIWSGLEGFTPSPDDSQSPS